MKLTNIEMFNYLNILKEISNKVYGKLGYAVARNIRKISEENIEYEKIRLECIYKYGTLNENDTYVIKTDTEAYLNFVKDMEEISEISHEIDIYKVDVDTIIKSNLSAQEIFNIDFMIKEEEEK